MCIQTNIPPLPFTWPPQNKMLICSLATGPKHIELLRIMAPTVTYYAMKYQMDSLVLPLDEPLDPTRPPAWDKVILIRHALSLYETVMWIDADAIICDPTRNIREALDSNYSMHLVAHDYEGKVTVNTGVWICRRDERVLELLDAVWNHTAYIQHPWWEQAALMDLIGYDVASWTFRVPTSYSDLVQYLDDDWNCRPGRCNNPVIKHYLNNKKDTNKMKIDYSEFLRRIRVSQQNNCLQGEVQDDG